MGKKCEIDSLVRPQNVFFPSLRIKLGLIKIRNPQLSNTFRVSFPKLSEAKVKAGVSAVLQVRRIIVCSEFLKKLTEKKKLDRKSFVAVVKGFLDIHKAKN